MDSDVIRLESPRAEATPGRAVVLRALVDAIDAGMPAPMGIDLHEFTSGNVAVQIRCTDDAPEDVDTWAAHLGLTASFDAHVFDPDTPRPWRTYNAGRTNLDTATIAGWPVDVWSSVSLTRCPIEHADETLDAAHDHTPEGPSDATVH
ncbi:MAG: hypothetical protein EPO06_11785 [Burkholderiaceae bacterium]|nr:MAG: hypothetical protein EPO06_11785 [Burkholderiaceae bacterium]